MLDFDTIQDIHPIVLDEMGQALQRIAERMKPVKVFSTETEMKKALDEAPERKTVEEFANMKVFPTEEEAQQAVAKIVPENFNDTPMGVPYTKPGGETVELHLGNDPAEITPVNLAPGEPANVPADELPGTPIAEIAGALDFDVDGIPWDDRIHAKNRSKVKAGTWKFKPRLDPALKSQVMAELRAKYPKPEAAAPNTTTAGQPLPDPTAVFGQPAPEQAVQPEAAAPDYTWVTFLEEMQRFQATGDKTPEEINMVVGAVLGEFGLTSIIDLQKAPQHVIPVRDRLSQLMGPRQG